MKSLSIAVLMLFSVYVSAQEKPSEKEQDSVTKMKVQLDEVKVAQKKKLIKVDSDKTTVTVKDNPMVSTGNAYEAIKKMPGVIASPTGGLSLNGRGVTIYIDGSPSTLTGTDLENYLTSLPAGAFEKIELIYSPGASFDANASGSVINLVTSSKRLKGVNANFNVNYNFNKYQKPSPQLLLNGKEKNLSWQTMLGYNYIDSEQRWENDQVFTSFEPDETIRQNKLTLNTYRNLYLRIGTNYKLSAKSNLLFNYNMNLANNREQFDAVTTGSSITDYYNDGTTKDKNNNHEFSLQYKTKLDTLGRNLSIIAFANTFDRNPKTYSNAFEGSSASFNNFTNDFKLLNYYIKYDFEIPFEKLKLAINTGGKFNVLNVDNSGNYFLNTSLPNRIDFDYGESNLAFYAEARKTLNKFNLTAGLRFEDFRVNRTGVINGTRTDLDFRNTNLFPNISAMYRFTDQINAVASYSRKIAQPGYRSLDPNGSNIDQYNSSTGNLLLDPTFFDNYEFKISAMDFIQLGVNYNVAKNQNMFVFDANPGELVSIQTFKQFDRYRNLSAYFNFPIPLDYFFKGKEEFQKRLGNIDQMNYIYVNINYIRNLTTGFDFSFESKPIWNYGAQAQIMLPWNIKSTMTYFILPKGTWEIYQITKPIQQFDISLTRDFMNKKLKLGIHAFDLFNQNEVNALVSATNLETRFHEKNDTRTFRISLSYNFGNLKLQNENTEIQTEKVKSGGGLVK